MLHNWGCCLGNGRTPPPPPPTQPPLNTHTHALLRQQDILRPHDSTGWFNACWYTLLMRWPLSDVRKLFLLWDYLQSSGGEASPLWWSTPVLFDKQIKHSPHFTTCTETTLLFMAVRQIRADKNVMWALTQVAPHNVDVLSGWMAAVWVSLHDFVWAINSTSWIQGQGGSPAFLSRTITTPGIPAQELSLCVEGYSAEYSLSSQTPSQSTVHVPSDSPSNQPLGH